MDDNILPMREYILLRNCELIQTYLAGVIICITILKLLYESNPICKNLRSAKFMVKVVESINSLGGAGAMYLYVTEFSFNEQVIVLKIY
jgi:hypothetical protein